MRKSYAGRLQKVQVEDFNKWDPALKPGRDIRVGTSGLGHPGLTRFTIYPGLTRFTIYPGLTRIGSREKRNCSFDDVETYKRYRVALS